MEQYLERKCGYLYDFLTKIKEYSKNEWERVELTSIPKHGIEHSEKMILFLEDIVPTIKPPLSTDELYILLSAIYVHDLGLQDYTSLYESGKLKTMDKTEFDKDDIQIIIDNHRIIIPNIITKMRSPSCIGHFPHHKIIEKVAMEHKKSKSKFNNCSNIETFGGENVRCELLISLLQCVDALHISSDRVNMEHIERVPYNSRKYWWEMYYIREVVIDQKTKRIRIHYEVPSKFRDNMEEFISFSEKRFKRFPGDAMDILWDYGLYLQVGAATPWIMLNDEKKMISIDIIKDIHGFLKKQNRKRIKQFKQKIKISACNIAEMEHD